MPFSTLGLRTYCHNNDLGNFQNFVPHFQFSIYSFSDCFGLRINGSYVWFTIRREELHAVRFFQGSVSFVWEGHLLFLFAKVKHVI